MIPRAVRPVLLVEGEGDQSAVPELFRRAAEASRIVNVFPCSRPIKAGDAIKLARPGEVEKWITYGCRRPDGNSVILAVESDDICPIRLVRDFKERIEPIARRFGKPTGIVCFNREFESLFLFCLQSIADCFPEFQWRIEGVLVEDPEEIRGCKETLRRVMGDRAYKETRDQVRFVTALNFDILKERSRSFQHFERLLNWLSDCELGVGVVYPGAPPLD